ncbi:hypothetical protein N0V85_004992 [Neurospora sp. IMI 360204]|nr:hypothetical protein N0V85_004992 [Neurospora sp. IMI 360204]
MSSSSSTTDGSNSHATTVTNTGEIPIIFGLPWITRTFNPSLSNITPTMHTSSYPAINPARPQSPPVPYREDSPHHRRHGRHRSRNGQLGEEEGEVVDVLILNAVGEMAMGGLLCEEEGGRTTVEIWGKLEANLRGPMRYTELFMKQGKKDRQKFLINISTASAHISHPEYSPTFAACPEYGFTKATAGLFFRYIAQQSDPERLQVVSFHPGTIYSEIWQGLGVEKNILPFDGTTKEARFIHGRFVWAHWDVDEMKAAYAERFEKDAELFRFGVCGLAGSNLHVTQ